MPPQQSLPDEPAPTDDEPSGAWPRRIPPLHNPSLVELVAQRARGVAQGRQEARRFAAILYQARRDGLEIEALYAELPWVLAGDLEAAAAFTGILDQAAEIGVGLPGEWGSADGGLAMPQPDGPFLGPCDPGFFYAPDAIFALAAGIDRVSGDDAAFQRRIDTLAGLWQRTTWLDHLSHQALAGRAADGEDRLATSLRLIARDLDRQGAGRGGVFDPSWPPPEGGPGPGLPGEPDPGLPAGPSGWPGPDDGPPLDWPPKRPPGGLPPGEPGGLPPGLPGGWEPVFPRDPCAFMRDACRRAVAAGARALRPGGLPTSVWSHTINAVEPPFACEGETVTLRGTFPATQPANVSVVLGSRPVTVVSWSASAIVVRIPPGAGEGCFGFRAEDVEGARRSQIAHLQGELRGLAASLGCLGAYTTWEEAPYVPSSAPCTTRNRFLGTVPVIEAFAINGGAEAAVLPGAPLVITWSVKNAATVTVQRVSADGPPLNVTWAAANPTLPETFSGSQALGTATATRPIDAEYRLQAANRCTGATPITATVKLFIRGKPKIDILGIEVTQAIQHLDLANPAQSNTVPLVARRPTVVRVYIDSGMSDGFDYGGGPNTFPLTGTLRLWNGAGGPLELTPSSPNPQIAYFARPAAQIDRASIFDTLNFRIPMEHVIGPIRFEIDVRPPQPVPGITSGVTDTFASPTFSTASRGLRLAVLRIGQAGLLPEAPTATLWERTIDLLPIAANGIAVVSWLEPPHITGQNLMTDEGLEALLNDVAELSEGFIHDYDVLLGLLPRDLPTARGGVGSADAAWPPVAIAKEDAGETIAHEIGHALGLRHGNCPMPPDPQAPKADSIDSTLPPRTEEEGLDFHGYRAVARNRGDLMSYCDRGSRWVSIEVWKRLFNRLA